MTRLNYPTLKTLGLVLDSGSYLLYKPNYSQFCAQKQLLGHHGNKGWCWVNFERHRYIPDRENPGLVGCIYCTCQIIADFPHFSLPWQQGSVWVNFKDIVKLADPSNPRSGARICDCLLYTSPSPRDGLLSRMPSSA